MQQQQNTQQDSSQTASIIFTPESKQVFDISHASAIEHDNYDCQSSPGETSDNQMQDYHTFDSHQWQSSIKRMREEALMRQEQQLMQQIEDLNYHRMMVQNELIRLKQDSNNATPTKFMSKNPSQVDINNERQNNSQSLSNTQKNTPPKELDPNRRSRDRSPSNDQSVERSSIYSLKMGKIKDMMSNNTNDQINSVNSRTDEQNLKQYFSITFKNESINESNHKKEFSLGGEFVPVQTEHSEIDPDQIRQNIEDVRTSLARVKDIEKLLLEEFQRKKQRQSLNADMPQSLANYQSNILSLQNQNKMNVSGSTTSNNIDSSYHEYIMNRFQQNCYMLKSSSKPHLNMPRQINDRNLDPSNSNKELQFSFSIQSNEGIEEKRVKGGPNQSVEKKSCGSGYRKSTNSKSTAELGKMLKPQQQRTKNLIFGGDKTSDTQINLVIQTPQLEEVSSTNDSNGIHKGCDTSSKCNESSHTIDISEDQNQPKGDSEVSSKNQTIKIEGGRHQKFTIHGIYDAKKSILEPKFYNSLEQASAVINQVATQKQQPNNITTDRYKQQPVRVQNPKSTVQNTNIYQNQNAQNPIGRNRNLIQQKMAQRQEQAVLSQLNHQSVMQKNRQSVENNKSNFQTVQKKQIPQNSTQSFAQTKTSRELQSQKQELVSVQKSQPQQPQPSSQPVHNHSRQNLASRFIEQNKQAVREKSKGINIMENTLNRSNHRLTSNRDQSNKRTSDTPVQLKNEQRLGSLTSRTREQTNKSIGKHVPNPSKVSEQIEKHKNLMRSSRSEKNLETITFAKRNVNPISKNDTSAFENSKLNNHEKSQLISENSISNHAAQGNWVSSFQDKGNNRNDKVSKFIVTSPSKNLKARLYFNTKRTDKDNCSADRQTALTENN
ncbi:UNKNOWN [Stylonychia lemnae]|uniref:Uncharacterized protein n=1 Tax=Stylonychia lemnae TaxID=5949 RepID=A0A078AZD1_STYLE|nr:UNKNOWN [Stylonychia lemnae]|eukprot:CDW86562.1 UNKNOWN [Stylonychia lemnae]